MFASRRGLVLGGVVLLVVLVTVFTPSLISGLDSQVGSYVMVAVTLAAIGIWLARRRSR
ncbi:MAG: hypothetical protein H0T53_16315 [Herpetosiphonaceae bacterium]|nr:hypothetical protein [Herpetosiphonaceae bacterium]